MNLLVSDVAQDVFAFLGRPSQDKLPLRDLIDVGSRKITSLIIDIFNTDRDYRVALYPVSFNARDNVFPYDGEIAELQARPKGSTSEDDWERWQKVTFGSDFGPHQYALYSGQGGRHIVFSESPSTYQFRALVEQGSVRLNNLTDDTTLSNLVQPLLFNRWALEAGAMVNDDSDRWDKLWARKERHLRLESPALEKQWQRYLEGGRGEEVSIREPFNARREGNCDYYQDSSGRFRSN